MKTTFKLAAAWVSAAIMTALLISIISSQLVLNELIKVGATVSPLDRLHMTVADLAILQALIPVLLACFLIGFLVATLCNRWLFRARRFWFLLAGASSIICTLVLMSIVMNLMPIAGARGLLGMALIGGAGAVGGLLFERFSRPKIKPSFK